MARDIIRLAGHNNCKLFLPLDIVVAEQMAAGVPTRVRNLGNVDEHERILDAGPETVERLKRAMGNSKTLIWNGPLGVFEIPPFDKGTVEAAKEAASLGIPVIAVEGSLRETDAFIKAFRDGDWSDTCAEKRAKLVKAGKDTKVCDDIVAGCQQILAGVDKSLVSIVQLTDPASLRTVMAARGLLV